jgi:membrane-bound serine protease (ClpP class)
MTFAANIAAMAPATHIGAATPIGLQSGKALDKAVNDAAASAASIAEKRGRNVQFATDTVRKGRSATADEALKVDAIDLIARNQADLLERIDGHTVTVGNGSTVRLDTADARVAEFGMPATRRLLQWFANPNLAFLFLTLGGLALLIALSVLPTSIGGVLLLALAGAMFVAELYTPGVGVFAGGGVLALIFAGLLLFQRPTGVGVGLAVLLPLTILVGLVVGLVGRLTWRTHKAPYRDGSIRGALGVVQSASNHTGQVVVHGTLWQARSMDGPLQVGERVRVVEREGMELIVYPEP